MPKKEQVEVEEVVVPDDLAVSDLEELDRPRDVPAPGIPSVRGEGAAAVGGGLRLHQARAPAATTTIQEPLAHLLGSRSQKS